MKLDDAILELQKGTFEALPESESTNEMADRIQRKEVIHEISEVDFRHFFNDGADFLQYSDSPNPTGSEWVLWSDEEDELRLFWEIGGKYFARNLTRKEAIKVCNAPGESFPFD